MRHTAVIIGATGGGTALAAQLFGKASGFCYLVGFVVGVVVATVLVLRDSE